MWWNLPSVEDTLGSSHSCNIITTVSNEGSWTSTELLRKSASGIHSFVNNVNFPIVVTYLFKLEGVRVLFGNVWVYSIQVTNIIVFFSCIVTGILCRSCKYC